MILLGGDLWLCPDCTVYVCNGDLSGVDSDARAEDIERGAEALAARWATRAMTDVGLYPSLVSDGGGEDEDGYESFSWRGCDCCDENRDKGGEFHRFAVIGPSRKDIRRARREIVWGRTPEERRSLRKALREKERCVDLIDKSMARIRREIVRATRELAGFTVERERYISERIFVQGGARDLD